MSRIFLAFAVALAVLSGCSAPRYGAEQLRAEIGAPYQLASGDRVRVIVFGQEGLTNSFSVDGAGNVSVPLIGTVRARGLTTARLGSTIEAHLRQGYLRDPHVSVEVEAFRPFFVLGEVGVPGQYPFVNGATVECDRDCGRFRSSRLQRQRRSHTHCRRSALDQVRAAVVPAPARGHDHGAGTVLLARS
jgi:polysaccharide export outer membrane protein